MSAMRRLNGSFSRTDAARTAGMVNVSGSCVTVFQTKVRNFTGEVTETLPLGKCSVIQTIPEYYEYSKEEERGQELLSCQPFFHVRQFSEVREQTDIGERERRYEDDAACDAEACGDSRYQK